METGLAWLKHARGGFHPRPNKGARSEGRRVTFSCFFKGFETNFTLSSELSAVCVPPLRS